MARVRSPSYPSYSLDEAIANARKIFEKDRRSPIDRVVVAGHLGYKSLNGAADKALATMMQYGLLEKVAKGEVRVSQWAIDILHPDTPASRTAALRNAALNPPLFQTLNERFPEGPPSNETLRSFLVREDYNDRAIGPIISAYTKTSELLTREGASESPSPSHGEGASLATPEAGEGDEPPTFGGARIGDLIQWESQGVLQFEKPKRVRGLSEDGHWVFVDGSETGVRMTEVIVEERGKGPLTPPPRLPLELGAEHPAGAGESEWMRNRLGADTKVRLLVTGDMGPREIAKLIKLLEAQRAVLQDDDDE